MFSIISEKSEELPDEIEIWGIDAARKSDLIKVKGNLGKIAFNLKFY